MDSTPLVRQPLTTSLPELRPLNDDAVFEMIDESFDGQGTDFRAGQIKRCGSAEGALRACEPPFRRFAIALEQFDRPSEHTRGPQQAV